MSDKIPLDPNQLTLRDLQRAQGGPLAGRNPMELLGGGDILAVGQLIAWCVRSRDDAEFTWEDAASMQLGDFEFGDSDQPPLTASPGEPGTSAATPATRPSRTRPPKRGPSGSSATTSD